KNASPGERDTSAGRRSARRPGLTPQAAGADEPAPPSAGGPATDLRRSAADHCGRSPGVGTSAAATSPVVQRRLPTCTHLSDRGAILPFLPKRETGAASDGTLHSLFTFVNKVTNRVAVLPIGR